MLGTARLSASLLLALCAVANAQTRHYTSPDGRFSLDVPADWQITTDPTSNQVDFHKGALTFSATVMPGRVGDTAEAYLNASDGQLRQQCPTYKHRDTHAVTLAGFPGLASLSTCADPKSPAIAETTAAYTPENVLVTVTAIAPAEHYAGSIALFNSMRDTLRVAAQAATGAAAQTPKPGASLNVDEVKHNCTTGVYTQEECARRLSDALAAVDPHPASTHISGTMPYRDPQNRFTVDVPAGWTAKPEGDNGSLGVQLRNGSDWINIMPSKAATTKEAVLAHERDMIAGSHLNREPPLGTAGLIQIFSHGNELTYDSMTASSPDGTPVDGIVAGIASMSGGAVILLGSSITRKANTPADASNVALGVAMSVQVPGVYPL